MKRGEWGSSAGAAHSAIAHRWHTGRPHTFIVGLDGECWRQCGCRSNPTDQARSDGSGETAVERAASDGNSWMSCWGDRGRCDLLRMDATEGVQCAAKG